jgi:SOS response regulatory protein OraA/RecX
MANDENPILTYALKLLSGRDYSVQKLREKLEAKFGNVPDEVFQQLTRRKFLNDRRLAENFVFRHKDRGILRLRQDLLARGIAAELADEILSGTDWPSLREALTARMNDWNLHAPLRPRDAARLFRTLARLGYEEDALREEIDQLHEQ